MSIEQDAAGNKKSPKDRSRERIDPAVAAIMAVAIAPERRHDFNGPLVITA